MSELIPANFGAVSTRFANTNVNDDLSSGVQSSFAIIGYKGKVWSLRYRGDDTPLMRDDGDGPRNSIEVVILKASQHVSKIWYEQGYVEGSNAAPDCFSNNGIVPEVTSLKPQCASCAACPMNQWGSRITPAGKSGKACADSKRLAVAPLDDINNEMFGGPMLLRVPAASLQDVAMYGQKMNQMGYPYFAVGTKISFDAEESYPKFIFKGLRPLNDEEADAVLIMRESHAVDRILSESEFAPAADSKPAADDEPLFEQAPEIKAKPSVGEQAKAAAAATKKAAPKKEAAPKVQPAPKVEPTAPVEEDEDAEIAAMMAALQAKKDAKAAAERKVQEEYAAKAKAAVAGPTPEEKAAAAKAAKLKALQEQMAALEAADEGGGEVTSEGNEEVENVSSGGDFAADLDSMLNDLLPS